MLKKCVVHTQAEQLSTPRDSTSGAGATHRLAHRASFSQGGQGRSAARRLASPGDEPMAPLIHRRGEAAVGKEVNKYTWECLRVCDNRLQLLRQISRRSLYECERGLHSLGIGGPAPPPQHLQLDNLLQLLS